MVASMGRNGTKGPPLQNRTETLRVITGILVFVFASLELEYL